MKPKQSLAFVILILLMLDCVWVLGQTKQNHALGRSAYADAIDMKETAKQPGILKAYGFKTDQAIRDFNTAYSVSLPVPTDFNVAVAGEVTTQSMSGGVILSNPSLGVDALGTFIANRSKQEINIAFLNKFKADIKDETRLPGSLLAKMLPETKNVLLSTDPYNYPVFLETLNQAFEEDIGKLPTTLPRILPALDSSKQELKILQSLLPNILSVNSGLDIIKTVSGIATEIPGTIKIELKVPIYGVAFALNAMNKGGQGDQMFLKNEDLDALADATTKQYYIALLIRQNQSYVEGLGIASAIQSGTKIINLIEKLVPVYSSLASQSSALASQSKQGRLTPSLIQESVSLVLKNLNESIEIVSQEFPTIKFGTLKKALQKGDSLNTITRLIIEKKYGIALLQAVSFVENNWKALSLEEKQVILRYTNFVANVLSAENKDDLVQALETSANPVGSYRIKRNSTFNISLNAYAGGFAGFDGKTFGFTAPVGVYFGWGNLGKKANEILATDKGKSFGFFLPIVDVGAVTAFRLQDDKTELANVSWSNVFAPGAFASFGFGKCPVSLNIGGQLGPELRSVDTSGNPVITEKEWLWRAALTIDIPIFDFYIKQKSFKVSKRKEID